MQDYEPPRQRVVVCGKIPYDDEPAARAAIAAVAGRRRKQSYSQHDRKPRESAAYKCLQCEAWHVTSMVQY